MPILHRTYSVMLQARGGGGGLALWRRCNWSALLSFLLIETSVLSATWCWDFCPSLLLETSAVLFPTWDVGPLCYLRPQSSLLLETCASAKTRVYLPSKPGGAWCLGGTETSWGGGEREVYVARSVGRERKTHRKRREFLKFFWVRSSCDQLLVEHLKGKTCF